MNALEARRAYQREWKRKNPEKVKAAQMRYWENKARKMDQENEQAEGSGKESAPEA